MSGGLSKCTGGSAHINVSEILILLIKIKHYVGPLNSLSITDLRIIAHQKQDALPQDESQQPLDIKVHIDLGYVYSVVRANIDQ